MRKYKRNKKAPNRIDYPCIFGFLTAIIYMIVEIMKIIKG